MAEKEKEKRSGFVGNAPPPLDPTEIRKAKKFSFLDRARIALTGKAPDNYFTASWRNVPAETALTQQKEQIFDLWRSEEYWRMVAKRYLPDLGLGFTTSPYVGPWEYVWGVTPVEDYAKYKEIFVRDPYVHAAITLMVQLTVSKGFQLFSNRPEGKEIVAYLENWCNQHDILEILRIVVTDMLVFGNAYLEVIRLFSCVEKDFQDDRLEEAQKHQEATGHKINSQITWLKPLPAETMRVNRDPWGSVLGYSVLPNERLLFYNDNHLIRETIGEYADRTRNGNRKHVFFLPSIDPETNKAELVEASHLYQLHYKGPIFTIKTKHGKEVKVTASHSVFGLKEKRLHRRKEGIDKHVWEKTLQEAYKFKVGDYVLVSRDFPVIEKELKTINIAKLFLERLSDNELNRFYVVDDRVAEIVKLNTQKIRDYLLQKNNYDYKPYSRANARIRDIISHKRMSLKMIKDLGFNELIDAEKISSTTSKISLRNKIESVDDLLLVLGFTIADGSFNKNTISWYGDNVNIVKPLLNYLGLTYTCGIGNRNKKKTEGKWYSGFKSCPNLSVFNAVLRTLFDVLLEGDKKKIPTFVFNLPRKQLKYFIAGLWFGDGWHKKTSPCFAYYSHNKQLAEDLSLLLARFGIVSSLHSKVVNKEKNIYSYTVYAKVNPINPLNWNDDIDKSNIIRAPQLGRLYGDKIVSIEKNDYEGSVYDFEVPFYQNFVNNGLIVLHNTQVLTFPPIHFLPSEIIFFKYEAKSWNYECFTPDTLVRTSNGFKKISDVKIGDKVIMHTGKWGKVLQVKSFPVDEELIEVRTSHSNIPILSTPTHPYYARPLYITSGGFKKLQSEQFVLAQNLKPRDYLLVPIDREEKDVPYILLGDYLDITTLNRVAPTKSKIHTKIQVNADFMYLVGLFLGDGCVIRDRITFAFNGLKEEQLAQETKELINNVFGLHAWITRPKNTNRLEVSVKSRFLSRLFKMLFNEGAHNKSIPEWIMKLPPYKQLHLLRGLFDSDGYTKKDGKSITISTVSENMAHQIYTLFLRQNQIPSIHKRTPKINTPFKDGHVAHSGTIYNITVYVRKTTKRGNGWAKGRIENDYLWLPIKSVKRVPYKGSVWNLEVDKEHTFTVGLGYAVHNSAYGISILRSLLRIEALIKEFEDVIGQAMWSYNFPKFIVEVGVEGKPPPTDSQMQEVMDSFAARGPGTDIFVRHGDVLKDVKVLEPPTAPLAASEWWLTYLTKNRAAALGVPEFFLGTVTGNRAAVDVISQEFVSRLTVIQNVLSKKLMRELFPSLIEEKFGKVEIIPEIVWNPIFDEPSDLKIAKAVQLFESGLVPLDEARLIVGKPALDKEIYGDFGLTFSPKAYGVTTQNPSSQPLVGLESSQSTTSAQPNAQSQSTQNNPRTALNDVSMWRKKYESDDDEPPEFLTREEFKEYLNNLKKRTMFPKVKGEE